MSAKPFLTIGMAVFDDFPGLWPTVQALRAYHAEVMAGCELIVVDNNPDSEHGKTGKDFLGWVKGDLANARYVGLPSPRGTAVPRQLVFELAEGDAVLCLDPHVLVEPWAIARLIEYYRANPDCLDLLQGPMVYDDLRNLSTHFDDEWRAEMWGTWALDPRGDPNLPDYTGEPFEIGACGLGLFSCKKEAWLGFNPRFRGFGGEEWYIHEKFRQAGRRSLCLPWLRWLHRFGRPAGVPYPLTRWSKVRNYVIGLTELGLSLERCRKHFCEDLPNPMPRGEWEALMRDPTNPPEAPPAQSTCGVCPGPGVQDNATLEDLFSVARDQKSDINEHATTLRELASQCDHVTEFGMRHGVSTVALLAGQPKHFITYDLNQDPIAGELKKRQGKCDFEFVQASSLSADIHPTDLLFIDTRHTADQVYAELTRHAAKVWRWIVLHDTRVYGEVGEDGGPGLLPGIRRFLRERPEWTVIRHDHNNNGLMVLSRSAEDKKELPGLVKQAWNYAKALARHAADGRMLTPDQVEARLDVCSLCPFRTGNRCGECGCYLDEGPEGQEGKALWASEACPLGKWPE